MSCVFFFHLIRRLLFFLIFFFNMQKERNFEEEKALMMAAFEACRCANDFAAIITTHTPVPASSIRVFRTCVDQYLRVNLFSDQCLNADLFVQCIIDKDILRSTCCVESDFQALDFFGHFISIIKRPEIHCLGFSGVYLQAMEKLDSLWPGHAEITDSVSIAKVLAACESTNLLRLPSSDSLNERNDGLCLGILILFSGRSEESDAFVASAVKRLKLQPERTCVMFQNIDAESVRSISIACRVTFRDAMVAASNGTQKAIVRRFANEFFTDDNRDAFMAKEAAFREAILSEYVQSYEKAFFRDVGLFDDVCSICHDPFVQAWNVVDGNFVCGTSLVAPSCNHAFHESCLKRAYDEKGECPMCRNEYLGVMYIAKLPAMLSPSIFFTRSGVKKVTIVEFINLIVAATLPV
jgi:RING-H2 zinc finger domain